MPDNQTIAKHFGRREGRTSAGSNLRASTHLARFLNPGPPMYQFSPEITRKHPDQTFAKHFGAGRGPDEGRFRAAAEVTQARSVTAP